ncbi:MAG TPA: type II toxin-antitoxin system RelE/ParE family toxin [Rhizomicrobium sp.]|nr:type II toxin-antitoxin system RelE/ParE family toxin [Rhizomicrobium sp.]
MIVRLSDAAEAELEAIGDWIALDAPMRAHSFIQELRDACERIGHAPEAYVLLPCHKASGIRRRVYRNYLIFYVITDHVFVLHIMNGARNYEPMLFPDGE